MHFLAVQNNRNEFNEQWEFLDACKKAELKTMSGVHCNKTAGSIIVGCTSWCNTSFNAHGNKLFAISNIFIQ
jgi:hypothetical protein